MITYSHKNKPQTQVLIFAPAVYFNGTRCFKKSLCVSWGISFVFLSFSWCHFQTSSCLSHWRSPVHLFVCVNSAQWISVSLPLVKITGNEGINDIFVSSFILFYALINYLGKLSNAAIRDLPEGGKSRKSTSLKQNYCWIFPQGRKGRGFKKSPKFNIGIRFWFLSLQYHFQMPLS